MRRIVTWALSTITTLVLLFSYHTSTSSSMAGATVQAGSATGNAGAAAAAAASGTFTGAAVSTRFGNVQVQISVSAGRITAATAVQAPNRDRRDQQINGYAVPILDKAAVAAQSADIDMVSGATITSAAYIRSLQSAIDQAGL